MYLRSVKLRGFKSFPDAVEVRLEPGVAVVVGPNGSGKSNVADAIVWAAGSLAPSALRAEKPEDVLFAGSSGRQPADHCEVELLFDNAAGDGPLPYAEISVARRLQRGGEGQYLVNRAAVRRTDVLELLAGEGLGHEMHAIIGQGRVEQVLSSKPAERRALIEEAAGLGGFKQRRHRAELKLERVAVQVDRARALEEESRKRIRPLALQATAAERAERLRTEVEALRVRLEAASLAGLEARAAELEGRRTEADARASAARRATRGPARRATPRGGGARASGPPPRGGDGGPLPLAKQRRAARDALRDRHRVGPGAARRRPVACSGWPPRRATTRRSTSSRRPRRSCEKPEPVRGPPSRSARAWRARPGSRTSGSPRSTAASPSARGCRPSARALADAGRSLALSLLDVDPGYENAVAAALFGRASAVLADGPLDAFELAERARREGLGTFVALIANRAPGSGERAPALPAAEPLLAHVRAADGGEPVAALLEGVWVVEPDELVRGRARSGRDPRGSRLRPGPRRALVRGRGRGERHDRAPRAPASARRRGPAPAGRGE